MSVFFLVWVTCVLWCKNLSNGISPSYVIFLTPQKREGEHKKSFNDLQ